MPLRRAVAVALPAWLASRALAALALLIAWLRGGHDFPISGHGASGAMGIWAWDGAWYRSIAEHGYAGQLNPHGERFFPLFPLLGRWLGDAFGGRPEPALMLLANLAALGFAIGVALLVRREIGDRTAVAATWLTMLAPGAVVLAIPYAEPLAGMLSVAYLLAVRGRGRLVWWAVPVGVLAGLARPTGLLLAVVPLVELVVRRRSAGWLRPDLLAAAVAPVAGAAIYCAWTAGVDGDFLLPFHAQSAPGLRGGIIADPLHGLLLARNHGGLPVVVRLAVAAVAIALLVVTWRVLPRSIAAWATLLLLAAVTSAQGTSLPRYLSADFPLLIALATLLHTRRRIVAVLVASAAGFVVVGVSGFDAGMVF